MKTYYNRLSSEEKKSLKKNIKNSKFNDLYKKVNYYLFLTYGCFFLVIADVYFRYYFSGKTIDYIVENTKGEQVYPILDVYIDICNGRKAITYKKFRCHCSC